MIKFASCSVGLLEVNILCVCIVGSAYVDQ